MRRLGDGVAVMVAALIGGRCQLLPVMVAVALVFLLCVLVRRLGDGGRSVFLFGIGRRSCSVSLGALCLSIRL